MFQMVLHIVGEANFPMPLWQQEIGAQDMVKENSVEIQNSATVFSLKGKARWKQLNSKRCSVTQNEWFC